MSLLFLCCMLCWVSLSHQQNPKIVKNLVPQVLQEGQEVTLKCIISNQQDPSRVAWMKDEEVVTNGTEVWRNTSIYLLETAMNNNTGKLIYKLHIASLSREDFGRWTCLSKSADSAYISVNIILNVRYVPDASFPICEFYSDIGILNCKTQEGNPRVGLQWYRQGDTKKNIRRSKEITSHGFIYSSLNMSTIDPPLSDDNETITCASAENSCSIPISYIYNNCQLLLTIEVTEKYVRFNCTVNAYLLEAEVYLNWSKPEIDGTKSSTSLSRKSIVFEKTSMLNDMSVYCRLRWGAYAFRLAEENIHFTDETTSEKPIKSNYEIEKSQDLSTSHSPNIALIVIILAVCLLILVVTIVAVVIINRKKKSYPAEVISGLKVNVSNIYN